MRDVKIRLLLAALAAASLLGSAPARAGAISGTVTFEGDVPSLPPIKMDADPGCAKKHGKPAAAEMLVLGADKKMANVFVRVISGLAKKDYPAPKEPVVLDQDGCQYKPHVLGVMVGQPVKILNSDGLLHNIHALPEVNKGFNQAMPASVKEAEHVFTQEEFMFKIKCDVHPWMGAYVAVLSHPYFDVTSTDGKFSIANLPPGTYKIEAWHEKLGTKTADVTISGDETKSVDFTLAAPAKRS
jgi:plastocyanin